MLASVPTCTQVKRERASERCVRACVSDDMSRGNNLNQCKQITL